MDNAPVTNKHLVTTKQTRNQRSLHVNGWLETALLVTFTLAVSAVTAYAEQICTHGQNPMDGTVACYSDAGCELVASLGGEAVRGYDESSAPFALARGKITAIVTSSPSLIDRIRKVGGSCRQAVSGE